MLNIQDIVSILLLLISCGQTRVTSERKREAFALMKSNLIKSELQHSVGANLILDKEEAKANDIIMRLKHKELDEMLINQDEDFWTRVNKSNVYKIIRKMPKGAILHMHSPFMLDADSLIEMTYEFEEYVFVCFDGNTIELSTGSGPSKQCATKSTPLREIRKKDAKFIDTKLKEHFCLDCAPRQHNESLDDVWKRFEGTFFATTSFINLRPVRERYVYKCLEKAYEDNVKYIELRSNMAEIYELDGTVHELKYLVRLYKNITDEFVKTHQDFIGIKFIVSAYRRLSNQDIGQSIKMTKELKLEMPDIIAGFDLVGQEDLGRPLIDFVSEFSEAGDIDFYFHAGETNWFGTSSDENLVDALLLGTKRIGHGYALIKHPVLLEMVKNKDIAIEVNPLSNSRLNLVYDLRNHPLASYLAADVPVVISSDDPVAFKADPLSHDFYAAFVIIASRHHDLRMLKTLALNSIKYSALDEIGKEKMYNIFNNDWKDFINYVNTQSLEDLRNRERHVGSSSVHLLSFNVSLMTNA